LFRQTKLFIAGIMSSPVSDGNGAANAQAAHIVVALPDTLSRRQYPMRDC
jgi:hypothetical protein